jgi:hypothetical protein
MVTNTSTSKSTDLKWWQWMIFIVGEMVLMVLAKYLFGLEVALITGLSYTLIVAFLVGMNNNNNNNRNGK